MKNKIKHKFVQLKAYNLLLSSNLLTRSFESCFVNTFYVSCFLLYLNILLYNYVSL